MGRKRRRHGQSDQQKQDLFSHYRFLSISACNASLKTGGRHSRELHLYLHFVSHADSEVARRLDAKGGERNRKAGTHAQCAVALLSLQIGHPVDRVLLAVQSELCMERHRALFGALYADLLEPCGCKCVGATDLQVLIFHMPVPVWRVAKSTCTAPLTAPDVSAKTKSPATALVRASKLPPTVNGQITVNPAVVIRYVSPVVIGPA